MKVRHIPSNRKKISFKRHYMSNIFPETLRLGEEVKLLSDDEVQKILRLNTKLFEVGKAIVENEKKLETELETKKASGEIYDYMMESTITYYSSTLGDIFYEGDMAVGLCADEEIDDWNDTGIDNHPIFTMKHCWLFHALYGHMCLSLRAIALIDSAIWETTAIEEHAVRFDI